MSIEDRIRAGLSAEAEARTVELAPPEAVMGRARRRRRLRLGAVAAVVVAVVGAGGVALVNTLGLSSTVVLEPSPPGDEAPALDPAVLDEHTWQPLAPDVAAPEAEASADTALVWTGDEALLFGGTGASAGVAYDPAAATWRELAASPLSRRGGHVAVWTGEELLIWGGRPTKPSGAAYDPAADQWRVLADAPIPVTEQPAAVWTGEELLVWGGTTGGGGLPEHARGAAYDPDADTWRQLPAPPIAPRRHATAVWTGEEMLVWGGQAANNPPVDTGAAYDPASNSWRELASAPASGFFRPSAVWTGEEMLIWGWMHESSGQETETVAYRPDTDTWRELSPAPLDPPPPAAGNGGQSAVWAGNVMLAWTGTLDADGPRALAFNPDTDEWTRLSRAPTPALYHPKLAWTGDRLLVWGGPANTAEHPQPNGAQLRFHTDTDNHP